MLRSSTFKWVKPDHLGKIAILGAGVQGRRLGLMWASQGATVNIIDINPKQLQEAKSYITKELPDHVAKINGKPGKIELFSNLEKALENVWMVVENLPEILATKRSILKQLDSLASMNTIIATNSSSYTSQEFIEGQDLRYPERIVSTHSYWPPETNPIELMSCGKTDPAIMEFLNIQTKRHGFEPFVVKGQSVGYIYNRYIDTLRQDLPPVHKQNRNLIWAAIKREALHLVEEGVATPEEVDNIYKAVLKVNIGVFQQLDIVGNDTALNIEQHYADVRKNLPMEPRTLLKRMVSVGKLGVKSGEGFYKYNENDSNKAKL